MKILMLTSVYASDDIQILNNTSVCHYFAREWVKNGHDVKVIYSYPIYIRILHWIASVLKSQITRISNSSIRTKRITKNKSYELDGVQIERLPLFKPLPLGKYPSKSIKSHINNIIKINRTTEYIPDLIVGHFHNPNLELISLLKEKYKVPTCLVLHGDTKNVLKLYNSNYKELLSNIDIWGYRSKAIQNNFENLFGNKKRSFICYSGIPKKYLTDFNTVYSKKISDSFAFVGSLIKRKYPISLIKALPQTIINKSFSIDYIGDGFEKASIEFEIKKNGTSNNVVFWGKLTRDEVQEVLESSEYFVMISENESFGLVYLEAMAKGCITIASKNEGMDGIIIHGENGFLCEAGNYKELVFLINYISNLSIEEKTKISKKAILTANNYSDFSASNHYIKSIVNSKYSNKNLSDG